VNEYELYFLSPQAPPWRVAGLLHFTTQRQYCLGNGFLGLKNLENIYIICALKLKNLF
jgi:hypothetical protein